MLRPILFMHWKQIRFGLVPFIIASFGLPLMTVQGLGTPPGMVTSQLSAYQILQGFDEWLPMFPLLALAIGVTLALSAWNWDHQHNHVYALSLPVTRTEYAATKLGAGMILALLPVFAMLIGTYMAVSSVALPAGLNAYPLDLTMRFFLAILIAYGVTFAMAAGTFRTTIAILSAILIFFIFGTMANEMLAADYAFFARNNVVEIVVQWMATAKGPFEVFTGSWALIDV